MNEMKKGFVFQGADIKKIFAEATPWLTVEENQDSFIYGVEEENFKTGQRINAKVVGIRGDIDENYVELLLKRVTSNNKGKLFAVPVKVATTRDVVDERFDIPYIIAGTCAAINGDEIDILTDEEREFRDAVRDLLGNRTDKYANLFAKYNIKSLNDRELQLMHKIKAEMRHSPILKNDIVTPVDLVSYFIEVTAEYVQTTDELEQLLDGMARQLESRKEALQNESDVRSLDKDHKLLANRIEEVQARCDYFNNVINQVILPVLK